MTKIFLDGKVVVGEATQNMILVFNRTETPKHATSDGVTLGGKERAWVDPNDSAVQAAIESGYFRVLQDGKVASEETVASAPTKRRRRK